MDEVCLWWITVGKLSHEGRDNQEVLMTVDRRVQQGAELTAGQMLLLGDLKVPQRETDKHSCCLGVFHELQTTFTSPYEPRWKQEAKAVNDQ